MAPKREKKKDSEAFAPAFPNSPERSLARLIDSFKRTMDQRRADAAQLTPREWDVLELLGKRYTDGQIAEELGITEHAVRKHTASLRAKLRLKSRRELYAWYLDYRDR